MTKGLAIMARRNVEKQFAHASWKRFCSETHDEVSWNGPPGCWMDGCPGMGYTYTEKLKLKEAEDGKS